MPAAHDFVGGGTTADYDAAALACCCYCCRLCMLGFGCCCRFSSSLRMIWASMMSVSRRRATLSRTHLTWMSLRRMVWSSPTTTSSRSALRPGPDMFRYSCMGLDSACYVLSPCSAEQGMYPNGSACPALWAPEHGDLAAGPLGVAPQRDLPL
jgi:hypothetical protein